MAAKSMYKLKPIHDNISITDTLPTNMYRVKNFHGSTADNSEIDSAELQELLNRQQAVLQDLEKLKGEINQISSDIGILPHGSYSKPQVSSPSPEHIKKSMNIVVSASPDDPPLSLLLLLKLLQHRGLACSVISHVHSSLSVALPDCLKNLLENSDVSSETNVCFRIIWKNQLLAPTLMVSVAEQSPIVGELSILRYICRMFFQDLYCGYEQHDFAKIESWLEAALKATASESVKEAKSFAQTLNSYLGKGEWLVGDQPSLADIYCSLVLQKTSRGGSFQKNVQKWLSACRKEFSHLQDIEKMIK